MKLPFTVEQFLEIFKNYNQSVFPMQIVFYLLGAAILSLSIKKPANADKIINVILSFFWLWMGIVYHLIYFVHINKAAYLFGGIFILQGLLFFYKGVLSNKLSYQFRFDIPGLAGSLLIIFALIIYPFFGYLFGHFYPASPTFGLPCPTTIFTFGILLWSDKKISLLILIIPFMWSVIGFVAALQLGIREDVGLLVSGIAATTIITFQNKKITYSAEWIRFEWQAQWLRVATNPAASFAYRPCGNPYPLFPITPVFWGSKPAFRKFNFWLLLAS